MKITLSWIEGRIAKTLSKKDFKIASAIIEAAFPGYTLRKTRADKGTKKGEKDGERDIL